MTRLHTLIRNNGRQAVLELDYDRRVVDAAAGYLATEDVEVGFLFSGWAYTPLPHRRLKDDETWTVRTDHASVVVQPGLFVPEQGEPIPVGVPYGSRARLILLYLQTQAIKNQSREIELGHNLTNWMRKMNIPKGGKSYTDVREQADRIARCRLTFQFRQGSFSGLLNQHILDQAVFVGDPNSPATHFAESVKLSEGYYEQLKKHPLPVEDAAIRQISNNSMAIDLYIWLAYRLHALSQATQITWKSLHVQFGSGYGRLDNFKLRFKESMALALAVYPDADVRDGPVGIVLNPSRPPVSSKTRTVSIER